MYSDVPPLRVWTADRVRVIGPDDFKANEVGRRLDLAALASREEERRVSTRQISKLAKVKTCAGVDQEPVYLTAPGHLGLSSRAHGCFERPLQDSVDASTHGYSSSRDRPSPGRPDGQRGGVLSRPRQCLADPLPSPVPAGARRLMSPRRYRRDLAVRPLRGAPWG